MNVNRIVFAVFLVFVLNNTLSAQTYQVKSLDGVPTEIKLNYKLFSKKLVISSPSDTLYLLDYTSTESVEKFDENFLKIEYNVLGGTGIAYRKTAFISLWHNKIVLSMFVTSYFKGNSPRMNTVYKLKFRPFGDLSSNNYKILIDVSNERKSNDVKRDLNSSKTVELFLDQTQKVFYSNLKNINKYFIITNPKSQKEARTKVKSKVLEISLGDRTYYHLSNNWYEVGNAAYTYDHKERLGSYAYK